MRDLLLWQDVYVWEGLGGAGAVSSSQVSGSWRYTCALLQLLLLLLLLDQSPSLTCVHQGSQEGSESGEGILAEEIDKLQVVHRSPWIIFHNFQFNPHVPQNGCKDSCPPSRRLSSSSSQEEQEEQEELEQEMTSPCMERRRSLIESSTDTLVPEQDGEGGECERSRAPGAPTPAVVASRVEQQRSRLLEEAMGVSSCSSSSTEPLDSDGLVAHNDQVASLASSSSCPLRCSDVWWRSSPSTEPSCRPSRGRLHSPGWP